MFTKEASGSAMIDALMAAFNAVSLLSLNPAAGNGASFQEFLSAPIIV
jgi:phage terminase large subunit-like protein